MEEVKVGISELKDVLELGLQISIDVMESLSDDGKLDWTDSFNFKDSVFLVPDAIEGIDKVWAEIKDLDSNEILEIKAFILTKAAAIDGIEERWLAVAENAINTVLYLYKTVKAIRG